MLAGAAVDYASAEGGGRALRLEAGSTVKLTRCTFTNSSATNGVVGSLSSITIYSDQSQFEPNPAAGSAGVFDPVGS